MVFGCAGPARRKYLLLVHPTSRSSSTPSNSSGPLESDETRSCKIVPGGLLLGGSPPAPRYPEHFSICLLLPRAAGRFGWDKFSDRSCVKIQLCKSQPRAPQRKRTICSESQQQRMMLSNARFAKVSLAQTCHYFDIIHRFYSQCDPKSISKCRFLWLPWVYMAIMSAREE